MKVLILDTDHCGLDIAWRAREAGHQVKWWEPPEFGKPVRSGEGFPGIEKVPGWRQHMGWAKDGLIINLFNDKKIVAELDKFRAFGFPVFGPSSKSAEWERNRGLFMKVLQKHGIEVPPFQTFNTLDEAIKFAWKTDDCFVFKTVGDEEDKSLSFVPSSPEELIGWMQAKKSHGLSLKGPCMLQEKVEIVTEVGVSAWMGATGFLPGKFNLNFEFKKLMPGDYGQNTGEMGCYSADTEVLTDSGWKFWPDVVLTDKLATLVAGRLEFEVPSALVAYNSPGTMIQWKNRSVDVLVTPNHNMYVCGQYDARCGAPSFKFVQAQDCTQFQYLLARTAQWGGVSPEVRTFVGNEWHTGMGPRKTDSVTVAFNKWAAFLGLWFAEGCASHPGAVNVAQSHPAKADKAEKIIAETELPYKRHANGFRIHCSQVGRELQQYGKSFEKRVPQYIKDAHSDDIAAFLDGFALGDGHTQPNGSRVFYTSNRGLADDLQELMLRCGRLGIIKKRNLKTKVNFIDGRQIIQRRPAYEVFERTKKITGWLDLRDREEVPYEGKVYCATVSSHVLYVRRNGRPLWCGNTVTKYTAQSRLADEVLVPLEQDLMALGHIGDFDVGVGIDSKGRPLPFECSARFGWPSTPILMACHKGDPVQWMKDSLSGRDTLEVDDRCAIGVVMACPPFPKNEDPADSTGYPISGIEEVWGHVSPFDIMLAPGPVDKDGKRVLGETYQTTGNYVCVVTALGHDVHDCIAEVYATADRIKFPDRIVRTDIGAKLEKELPKLHAFGYTEAPSW